MLGWFKEEMARASRSKRCLASGLSDKCVGRILTATVRSRRVSLARYTSPMPPAPSGDWISYGPSLLPEVRAIRRADYTADAVREHIRVDDKFCEQQPWVYPVQNGFCLALSESPDAIRA